MATVLCLIVFTLPIFGPVATSNGTSTEQPTFPTDPSGFPTVLPPGTPEYDSNTHVDDSDYFRLLNAEDGANGEMRFDKLNPKFTENGEEIVEGDMVLTEEQKRNRKAVTNLWPYGIIPFAITSSSSPDRSVIIAGINHWIAQTCLRFYEVSESYRSGPHIRFYKGPGCFSQVGRIYSNYGQYISIGSGCAYVSTVAHEIGHAIGFHHEQARPDRNYYVRVVDANVQSGHAHDFAIAYNSYTYGVPYDYTSIMHYGTHYWSNNGQPTLVAVYSQYNCLLGSGRWLSHYDKKLANLLYNCAGGCSSKPYCYYGGYVNKYCTCTCPRGTYYSNCSYRYANYYPSC